MQRGSDLNNESGSDYPSWISLSDDGNTVAIGSWNNENQTGHTRIYAWNGSAWVQRGSDIDGETSHNRSGYSVSLSSDGNTVAIGAPHNDGGENRSGHTRIYAWNGSSWVQRGSDIDGESAGDNSGHSVSLSSDGSTVAQTPYNDDNGNDSGHTRIYKWDGSAWNQLGSDIDGEAADDYSGKGVALSSDGTIVAIGANGNDGGGDRSGHTRIYAWNGSSWVQRGSDIDGESAGDSTGSTGAISLSGDGNIVAIGAPSHTNGKGQTRLFQWDGGAWNQIGSGINGEEDGDFSGVGIALSRDGSTVAIGESNEGDYEGQVRVFSLPDSTAPTVQSVSSSTADGTYKAGDVITINVVFSEAVTVNTTGGNPQLTLETGSSDQSASYASGTGTSTLAFSYIVQAGDTSSDLNYEATSSLALNGGTIKDAAGNSATLTLPALDGSDSLASNSALVIDTTAPTFSSAATNNDGTKVVLTYDEALSSTMTTTSDVTGVTQEGPSYNQTGNNLNDVNRSAWVSVDEPLGAGERLVLDNAFLVDLVTAMPDSTTVHIGLKASNWANTEDIYNAFIGDLNLKIERQSADYVRLMVRRGPAVMFTLHHWQN